MSLRCKIGLHSWNGCECSICGKWRDEQHDWSKNCEECSICNKKRFIQHDYCRVCGRCKNCDKWDWFHRGYPDDCRKCSCGRKFREDHNWDGCTCKACSAKRDEQHDYSADCEYCSKCSNKSGNKHSWDGCICTKCKQLRQDVSDEQHNWSVDCEKCSICGKTRNFKHEWSIEYKKCIKCNKIGDEYVIFKSALDSNNSSLVDTLVKQGAKLGYSSSYDILNNAINNGFSDTVEVLLINNYPLSSYAFKCALQNDNINIIRLLIKHGVLDKVYNKETEKVAFIPFLISYMDDLYNRKKSYERVFYELKYEYMNELLLYLIENPIRSDVRGSVINLFIDYSEIIDRICQDWDGVYDLDRQIFVFKTCENTINELINIKTKTSTYILNLYVKHKQDLRLCTVSVDGFAMNHTVLSLDPLRKKAEIEIMSREVSKIDHFSINSEEAWKIKKGYN